MRKNAAKIAALMLGAAMALTPAAADRALEMVGETASAGGNAGSGSSTQAEESDKNAIKDLVTYEAPNREQEGFLF